MPEPTDDTSTPRPDRHADITRTTLAEEQGAHYAALINDAAGLRFMLNMSAPALDLDDADQLAHRTQLLWKLHGRLSAAAVLLTLHGQPEDAAFELAEMHTMSLAAAVEQDAKDQHSDS